MSLDDLPHGTKAAALFTIPTLFGFVIDISAGMLMTICGGFAWLIGQLVWQIGSQKARTHKLWVEAENARIRPELERATAEREELRGQLVTLERRLGEAIEAERDLALGLLEQKGIIRRDQ